MNNYEKNVTSKVYRLTEPGVFKEVLVERQMNDGDVDVTPYLASVCHADLRYFNGNRRPEALAEKLPMALFHEGIGTVNQSNHPEFKKGDRVVIVPNIPGYVLRGKAKEECCVVCQNNVSSNYCLEGVFLASGYDGMSQSNIVISGENIVKIPDEIDDHIAILAELCSVSLFAINRAGELPGSGGKVAVFGDGPVGYLTAASLRYIYNLSKEDVIVFGAVPEKLNQFEEFATTFLVQDFDFTKDLGVQTIFECTGGQFSSSAINQAIDLINREGTVVLVGVTEELVPINTRDVLEKGLRFIGSSRSTTYEFKKLMDAFRNPEFTNILNRIIPDEVTQITTPKDLEEAMIEATNHRGWEKIYLSFDWNE